MDWEEQRELRFDFRGYDQWKADDSQWDSEEEVRPGRPYRNQAVRTCMCRWRGIHNYFSRTGPLMAHCGCGPADDAWHRKMHYGDLSLNPQGCICGPLHRHYAGDYFHRVIVLRK